MNSLSDDIYFVGVNLVLQNLSGGGGGGGAYYHKYYVVLTE